MREDADPISPTPRKGDRKRMKATSLLEKQHQEVKGLFRKIDKSEDASTRQELMSQIIQKLTVHSTIEEEIFYPAVRGLGSQKAEDIILEAVEEHHVVKLVLEELPTMDPEDEHFFAKMTVLSELVEHHADEDEDEMFALATTLGRYRRRPGGRHRSGRARYACRGARCLSSGTPAALHLR